MFEWLKKLLPFWETEEEKEPKIIVLSDRGQVGLYQWPIKDNQWSKIHTERRPKIKDNDQRKGPRE